MPVTHGPSSLSLSVYIYSGNSTILVLGNRSPANPFIIFIMCHAYACLCFMKRGRHPSPLFSPPPFLSIDQTVQILQNAQLKCNGFFSQRRFIYLLVILRSKQPINKHLFGWTLSVSLRLFQPPQYIDEDSFFIIGTH